MDHLPLPPRPVIGTLPIPFLYHEPYDSGPFRTYPSRTGWSIIEGQWPESLSRHGAEVSDDAEIASLLQTWLYFGLIREFTGDAVNIAAFRAPGRTRAAPHLTSKPLVGIIGSWAIESISMPSDEDEHLWDSHGEETELLRHELETWLLERQDILDIAEDIWKQVLKAYQESSSTTLNLVLLSIAALGQHLNDTLKYMANERRVQDEDRSTLWLGTEKLYQPILYKMQNWCPNKTHSIMETGRNNIGVLWYLVNLQPPEVHDGHSTCTLEQCNSLHVDQHDYKIRHVSKGCHCSSIGPSTEELIATVGKGSIALFTVEHNALEVKIGVREESDDEHYVAISHVWADGQGNLEANSLPICVLERLQKDVDALGLSANPAAHTPIWMDTICLPRHPLSLRREVVTRLTDVFTRATGVLVVDSYLKTLECSHMLPIEILARVSISGWTARLWTFSEGRLAKRIWFQFRDGAMDLHDFMDRYIEDLPDSPIPLDPLFETTLFMSTLYSASTLLGKEQEVAESRLEFGELKTALTSRQTSWPDDEALCLGAIFRLDSSKIVRAHDCEKMAAFWRQVDTVPVIIIFNEFMPKLEEADCRWAPATMLGGANQKFQALALDFGLDATPTDRGLEFTLDATVPIAAVVSLLGQARKAHAKKAANLKCNFINICRQPVQEMSNRPGHEFVLRDDYGRWYHFFSTRPWHQTPVDHDPEHHLPMIVVHLEACIAESLQEHDDQLEGDQITVSLQYTRPRPMGPN